MLVRVFILVLSVTFCLCGNAQDKSNRGKEFWLGYGFNYSFFHEFPTNNQQLAIYISTEQAATVTVSINNTGFSQTLNIPANTVDATVLIPKSGPDDARILTDGFSNRGIHIVSNVPVAVYAHQYAPLVSGATMLMPVETYGYAYYSINYTQTTSGSQLPAISPTTQNGPDWYSWFFVVAAEDNTRIEITPSDTTKNGWLPTQTYTVNLNKGEIYTVFGKLVGGSNLPVNASKDMTGSKIISIPGADGNCHPIGVFSGSGGIRLCRGDGGEFVHQQVFPSQAWGTRYLTYHTINNGNTDILETNRNYYRVSVLDPTAVVKRNGVPLSGIVNNFYYEFMDSTGGDYIESDKPVLVSQYTTNKNQCWALSSVSYGDPEMFYLSPIEQGQKNVLFYVSRNSNIDYVYTNIHLPTTAINSLLVDGAAVPAVNTRIHPNNPAYTIALVRLFGPSAPHTITCDSTFTATVYGLGFFESYGYNVGTLINNLNHYSNIKNTFNTTGLTDTFTCPKSPTRLFVKVGFPATSIHWKLSQVPGMFPNTDSIIANPVPINTQQINGRTYYTYTLQQDFTFANTGTYNIPVSYTANIIPNCNQTENANVRVVVLPGPVANFSATDPACLKDSVYFTATPVAGNFTLVNHQWNFADNTTASGIQTAKKFAVPGNQAVKYTVYANNGCLGDTTKTITIHPSPVAKFGVTTPICATDSVLVTDTSSIASGTITSWKYIFGDGNSLTRNTNTPFYHTYNTAGTYTIQLIVNSNNGCFSDTFSRPVNVNGKPLAKFGYDRNICAGDSIRFTDSSSIVSGTIVSWNWNFGDGNAQVNTNGNPFFHRYLNSGSYTVTLVTISNNNCKSDTARRTVIVSAKPVATFTVTGTPCLDSVMRFTSSYTNTTNTAWYWNFGDGQSATITTGNTATHAYTSLLNNITVKHIVDLGQGCRSDTATITIPIINPNPVAAFVMDTDTLCAGTPIKITSPLTGISNWNWNFGNGTGNNIPPFAHVFSNPGNYNVVLIVKTAAGCGSAPVAQAIAISPNPMVNAGLDQFINPGASIILSATATPAGAYNYLWTPATGLSADNILTPTASPAATTTYKLRVTDNASVCFGEDEVVVNVITGLYIPTVFTPNRDGLNDVWEIPGLVLYPDAVVSVFNRFGQKIYETKNYHNRPWMGTFNGTSQPVGTYVYLVRLNDAKKQVLKGVVTIIR
jgi:gliding motility-associated-like protein